MARKTPVPLNIQHCPQDAAVCCLKSCSCSMNLDPPKWKGTRERLCVIFLLALVALLLPAPASTGHSPRHASSLPQDCVERLSPAKPACSSADGADGAGEACQHPEGLPTDASDSLQPAETVRVSCMGEQLAGGTTAAETQAAPVSSVQKFHYSGQEQQLVERGSLIHGKYLLIDLLHPRLWGFQGAAYPKEDTSRDLDDFVLQPRVGLPALPDMQVRKGCCDEGSSDPWASRKEGTDVWQKPVGRPFHPPLPSRPLLLLPASMTAMTATTGAALVAAVVSVHSELVVARQRDQRPEGFCIDPFIILRAFPFWLRRPSLPSPESSSTSGTRYRLFGRLGGGAYGEVWRAVSMDTRAPFIDTVLKRLRCATGGGLGVSEGREQQLQHQREEAERVRRGFAREVFFGLWLRGVPHISRFLEVLPTDPPSPSAGSSPAYSSTAEEASADSAAETAAAAASAFLPEMRRVELLTVAQSARQGCEGKWLVFVNEGSSLTHLFFVADSGGSGLLEPSALWWHLKASATLSRPPRRVRQIAAAAATAATAAGDAPFLPLLMQLRQTPDELLLFLRSLLQQLLLALQAIHRRQVTHRDVKLENVLLQPSLPPEARLADWGSAISNNKYAPVAHALKALLGDEAPSILEETDGYQPPEVLAEAAAQSDQQQQQQQHQHEGEGSSGSSSNNSSSGGADSLHRLPSYDMWCVGLIFLKLVLGTPTPLEAFDTRRSARLARTSGDKPLAVLRRDLLVAALGDLCLIPWQSDRLPAPATPTAVAVSPQPSFLSSLKLALISATEGLYRQWASLLFGEDADAAAKPDDTKQQEHHELLSQEATSTAARNAAWQLREMRKEELFELLARVRGEAGGGELVVRPELAVQRQQRSAARVPFDGADESEDFRPRTAPTRHHSDCNDALFADILKARDVAGVGVPNPLARDLLRRLLAYDPQERLTAEAALKHPWFAVAPEAAGAVDEPNNKER